MYILTDSKYQDASTIKFPTAISHSIFRSRKGLPAAKFERVDLPGLSDELIEYSNTFKSTALDMMGRESKDAWTFSYNERKWHFLWLLKYWSYVINQVKPTILISRNIPHFASEYVLFKVCELHGIPCLAVENIAPLELSYITQGINNRASSIINEQDRSTSTTKASPKTEEFLVLLKGERIKAIPSYVKEKIARIKRENSLSYLTHRAIKDLLAVLLKGKNSNVTTNIKMNRFPLYDSRSWLTDAKLRLHKWQVRKEISKLEKLYQQLATKPNLKENYVFFAPNYQPERTTLPDAGDYGDLLFLIDTLSHCLPKSWKIIYKEHPTVFYKPGATFLRGHLYRSAEFYQRISSYNNVSLAPSDFDSFDLIDNAKAAATATGTVAYEASIRGVPAIMFGQSWACGCQSIFSVNSRRELNEAFEEILAGYKPSEDNWILYMNAAEKIGFPKVRLILEMYTKNEMNGPLQEEIKRLAVNFVRKIQAISHAK